MHFYDDLEEYLKNDMQNGNVQWKVWRQFSAMHLMWLDHENVL